MLDNIELMAYLSDEEKLDTNSLDATTPLFSSGILDSFAMMALVSFVEKKVEIKVKAIHVTLENFDSIQKIIDYINKYQND